VEGYPFLHNTIATVVTQRYQISIDDLPPYEDEKACAAYEAKLCRDFIIPRFADDATTAEGDAQEQADGEVGAVEGDADIIDDIEMDELVDDARDNSGPELVNISRRLQVKNYSCVVLQGRIGQDTLTVMIRQDELPPTRSRRRSYYATYGPDVHGKLNYPSGI
jgi:hypothetical protein